MSEREEPERIEEGTGAVSPTKPRPKKSPEPSKPRMLPPWKVILHNDDVNVLEDVVGRVQQLTTLNREEAIARTLEAHKSGSALLLTTHQERAELYVDQFASCGLTVTAEPDAQ